MRIAIGSDHRGYHLKEQIIGMLRSKGHEVLDEGTCGTESVDYPDFAVLVAKKVSQGVAERGVLICGTGIGMAVTANKFSGVRAAPWKWVLCAPAPGSPTPTTSTISAGWPVRRFRSRTTCST